MDFQFIPNTQKTSGTGLVPLDQIPEDIKNGVEEVYKHLKENPNGRMRVSFPSVGELNKAESLMKAYCEQRPEGQIRFRKSPTRGLPATTMDFRITEMLTETEQQTEEIRQATEAVKTAAKTAK